LSNGGSFPYLIQVGDYVLCEWVGEPSLVLLQQACQQIVSHPSFRKGMPVIFADRGTSYNPLTPEIQSIALELKSHKDRLGPMALVVQYTHHLGVGNMLSAYCHMEGVRLQVFRKFEDAVAWVREASDNPPPLRLTAGA